MRFYQTPLVVLLLLFSCEGSDSKPGYGQPITRKHGDPPLAIPATYPIARPLYPWDEAHIGGHPKITKEFFRCKGSSLNPPRTVGDQVLYDCGGSDKHSLPLEGGEEVVLPILIDLLNHVQAQTGHRVIITSGHRCPDHNSYIDPSQANLTSKHMVGAEVSFYVQGMEEEAEEVITHLQNYYRNEGDPSLATFNRYLNEETNTSIPPWYNKEIFIKLFLPEEGRNLDNLHPYSFITIQVKWDRQTGNRVTYNWDTAHRKLLRW